MLCKFGGDHCPPGPSLSLFARTQSGGRAASCPEHCRCDSCQWTCGSVPRALSLRLRVACSTSSRRDPFSGFDADRRAGSCMLPRSHCEFERVELAAVFGQCPFVTQYWEVETPTKKAAYKTCIYIYVCMYTSTHTVFVACLVES